jgi:oligopeptide/dipeptide ABC transporter ATP-binding protein
MTATPGEPLLSLGGLRIGLHRSRTEIVRGVDLDVGAGEKLGIVGESGSGKTLTILSILQLLPPGLEILGGSVRFAGEDLLPVSAQRLREVRGGEVAMVYQDPMSSLNPLLRVRTQIVETLRAHGTASDAAHRRTREVLSHVGLPDPGRIENAFPHELSGGMLQRVMIAMALATSPRLLVADEPTTALDVTIQQQILVLVERLQAETGMAVVWVTHDLGVVARLVDRVAVMYAGRIVEQAATRQIFAHPQHPYTAALIASLPGPATVHRAPLRQIGGAPPDPARLHGGCPFRLRCPSADERCALEEPPLIARGASQTAACWKEPEAWTSRS